MPFNDYFKEVPCLETDRLLLRPFCREDMETYLEFMHDPAVHRFLGGGVNLFSSEPHITNWLNNINGRLLKSKTVLTWCVELKSEKRVIGRVDLGGFVKRSMAELAYYFAKEYWGMGFASEAVKEAVRFGFKDLKLHRIQAAVRPENAASLRVLEKSGFQQEGLLRKYYFGKEFHDTVMLAAVREENLNQEDRL
ncbi:MAG: GNAT family N-acetyltransferase [Oscillospiraceae bacterium]|nr:GNAT family N-acetyltransferase [Oscillospiraceae bacterium]